MAAPAFKWFQTPNVCMVMLKLPEDVAREDVEVELDTRYLRIAFAGQAAIVDMILYDHVLVEQSRWDVRETSMNVTLVKEVKSHWPSLFDPEDELDDDEDGQGRDRDSANKDRAGDGVRRRLGGLFSRKNGSSTGSLASAASDASVGEAGFSRSGSEASMLRRLDAVPAPPAPPRTAAYEEKVRTIGTLRETQAKRAAAAKRAIPSFESPVAEEPGDEEGSDTVVSDGDDAADDHQATGSSAAALATAPVKMLPAAPELRRARALYDFFGVEDGDLSFAAHELIINIRVDHDSGWWTGACNGRTGLFPCHFVQLLDDKKTDAPTVEKARNAKSAIERSMKMIAAPGSAKERLAKRRAEQAAAAAEKEQREREKNLKVLAKSRPCAVVVYEYEAQDQNELTLHEGDTVFVINQNDDGWWIGACNGQVGLFPYNYVELKESAAPTESAPASATASAASFGLADDDEDDVIVREDVEQPSLPAAAGQHGKAALLPGIGAPRITPAMAAAAAAPGARPARSSPFASANRLSVPDDGSAAADSASETMTRTASDMSEAMSMGPSASPDYKWSQSGKQIKIVFQLPTPGMAASSISVDAHRQYLGVTVGDQVVLPSLSKLHGPIKAQSVDVEVAGDRATIKLTKLVKSRWPNLLLPPGTERRGDLSLPARALRDFSGDASDRDLLTFRAGEIVTVLDRDGDSGFWQGELDGRVGWFPMMNVQLIDADQSTAGNEQPAQRPQSVAKAKDGIDSFYSDIRSGKHDPFQGRRRQPSQVRLAVPGSASAASLAGSTGSSVGSPPTSPREPSDMKWFQSLRDISIAFQVEGVRKEKDLIVTITDKALTVALKASPEDKIVCGSFPAPIKVKTSRWRLKKGTTDVMITLDKEIPGRWVSLFKASGKTMGGAGSASAGSISDQLRRQVSSGSVPAAVNSAAPSELLRQASTTSASAAMRRQASSAALTSTPASTPATVPLQHAAVLKSQTETSLPSESAASGVSSASTLADPAPPSVPTTPPTASLTSLRRTPSPTKKPAAARGASPTPGKPRRRRRVQVTVTISTTAHGDPAVLQTEAGETLALLKRDAGNGMMEVERTAAGTKERGLVPASHVKVLAGAGGSASQSPARRNRAAASSPQSSTGTLSQPSSPQLPEAAPTSSTEASPKLVPPRRTVVKAAPKHDAVATPDATSVVAAPAAAAGTSGTAAPHDPLAELKARLAAKKAAARTA